MKGKSTNRYASGVLAFLLTLGGAFPALGQHEEEVAPLVQQFWTREVKVVQPRQVTKKGALELDAVVGVIPNDAFVIYFPLGLRLGYHLAEEWAIDLGLSRGERRPDPGPDP
jgi:hypothetical protein